MNTSYYCEEELKCMGFKEFGSNVKISRNCKFYGADKMRIGSNVRIDDFCIFSGNIELGNNVHIAVFNSVFAGNTGVILNDFCGLSSRCAIYAESDDYSGKYLTNPTVSVKYKGIVKGKVVLGRHVIVGTGSTILPGVCIGDGSAIGSMSLVTKSLEPWGIYVGVPVKYIKERSKELLVLENKLVCETSEENFTK